MNLCAIHADRSHAGCNWGRIVNAARIRLLALLGAASLTIAAVQVAAAAQSAAPPESAKAKMPLSEIPSPSIAPPSSLTTIRDAPEISGKHDRAVRAFEAREFDKAVKLLDEAIDAAGEDYFELYYQLAACKFEMENFGQARTACEKAVALRPDSADARYLLGRLYRRAHQTDRALEQFRAATLAASADTGSVRSTLAWFQLAECLEAQGYFTAAAEAYEAFDRAIWETNAEHRTDPSVAEILAGLPNGCVERRIALWNSVARPEEALRAAEWATRNRPASLLLARLHIAALIDAGKFDDALERSRERLSGGASNAPVASLAARAALKGGKLEPWLGALRGDASRNENDRVIVAVARALDELGSPGQSVDWWRVAAASRPADGDRAWALATAMRASGSLEESIETLARFVRERPEAIHISPERLKGWLSGLSEVEAFLSYAPKADRRMDRDFAFDFVFGCAAGAAGQSEMARGWLESSLKKRPEYALAHVALADLALERDGWNEAREHARAAIDAAPNLAIAHFVLAQALDGLDENDDAEAAFKAAIRHNGDEAAYPLALARHYQRTGNLLSAQRYSQQAFTADATRGEAMESLIDSYLASGKYDIARAQGKAAEDAGLADDVLRRIRTALRFAEEPLSDAHMTELKRQFAGHPDDVSTGLKLGASLLVRRETGDAAAVAEKLLNVAPRDERVLSLAARVASRQLEYDRALAMLRSLARRYPNRKSVLFTLAETLEFDFQLDEARRTWERLLELANEDTEKQNFRQRLYLSYKNFRDFDGALSELEKWMKADPEADGLLLEKVSLLNHAGRGGDGIELARKWLDEKPDEVRRWVLYRAACTLARDHARAEAKIREWVAKEPNSPILIEWLVETLLAAERAEEALGVANAFRSPTNEVEVGMRRLRANCAAKAGKLDTAVNDLSTLLEDRAIIMMPAESDAIRSQLVGVLVEARQFDRALEKIASWEKSANSDDPTEVYNHVVMRARVLQAAERTDEYIVQTRRAMELAERIETLAEQRSLVQFLPRIRRDLAGFNNDLGYTLLERHEDAQRAIAMIREGVAELPLNNAFLDSLGWAYYKAGDFANARKYLDRSTRVLDGEDDTVFDHLGDAEFRLGDREAARRSWSKALELIEARAKNPDTRDAEMIASIRSKLEALKAGVSPRVAPLLSESGDNR